MNGADVFVICNISKQISTTDNVHSMAHRVVCVFLHSATVMYQNV